MNHEDFMREALKEARKAFDADEVPVGAVLVINDKIVARGYNQVELLKDSTAHAEILALTSAYNALGTKYLPEASIYVTVEPCLMCSGAMYWGKVPKIYFGAYDDKNGYRRTTGGASPFHQKATVTGGILEAECAQLMKDFFAKKRK